MIGGRSQGLMARRRAPGGARQPMGGRGPALGRRRRMLPRPRPLVLAAALAIVLVVGGAWLWLRNSSLVAVNRVTVTGESGPDAGQIRSALTAAARNMTTRDVKMNQLRMAVEPYPVVKDLTVSTQFPHGMRIQVIEQVPVAVVSADGQRIAVAGFAARDPAEHRAGRNPPDGLGPSSGEAGRGRAVSAAGGDQSDHHGRLAWARRATAQRTQHLLRRVQSAGRQMGCGRRGAGHSGLGRSRLHRRHRPAAAGPWRRVGRRCCLVELCHLRRLGGLIVDAHRIHSRWLTEPNPQVELYSMPPASLRGSSRLARSATNVASSAAALTSSIVRP
jgi:hypothetical protein